MAIPPLLDELLRAHGASGHEDAVQAIVRREATAIGAEVERDVLGSTVARLRGSSGRLIVLVAHADQVGLVVRGADDDGLLRIAPTGTWLPADAWRQRVRVRGAEDEVRGVVVGERSEGLADLGDASGGHRGDDARRSALRDPSRRPDRARGSPRATPERQDPGGRTRRPCRRLCLPRGLAATRLGSACLGRRRRRFDAGREQRRLRRGHDGGGTASPGGRDRGGGHVCRRCAGAAFLGRRPPGRRARRRTGSGSQSDRE